MKKEFKLNFLGRDLIVETGQLAKQTTIKYKREKCQ